MLQVFQKQREDLALWYSSKPKYPLHIVVFTKAGFRGCITGMEQYFQGDDLSWRYQITQITEGMPVSSWWAEEDIDRVCQPAINLEDKEHGQEVSGRYLLCLDKVNDFVRDFGEKALADYRDRGVMRELRICFWDALREGCID